MENLKKTPHAMAGTAVSDSPPDLVELREGMTMEARVMTGSERFGHKYHRLLAAADASALVLAAAIALIVVDLAGAGADSGRWAVVVAVLAPLWILAAYQVGLYGQVERRLHVDYVTELVPTVVALTVWSWFLVLLGGVAAPDGPNLFGPSVLWLVAIPLILGLRAAARTFARTRPWFRRSVALIGDTSAVEVLKQRIDRHPEWGLNVGLRLTRCEQERRWQMFGRRPDFGEVPEPLEGDEVSPIGLTRLILGADIDRAIVAGGPETLTDRIKLAHTLLDRGVAVDFLAGGPETLYGTSITHHLEGMTLMSSRPSFPRPMDRLLKRVIDVVLSSILLVLTSPLLLYAAIRIKRESPGPVFFRQDRTGLNEELFEVVKLRTMYDGAHEERDALRQATQSEGNDDVLFKLDDDPRVTEIGRFLRRTSLDELPQLWNVLKGDMSMVGPRPLVPEEAEKAQGMYMARFNVKPGVAGPWQAEGRSEIPFEDMLRLDYSYVAGCSLGEDLKLLLRTFSAVVGRKGAK